MAPGCQPGARWQGAASQVERSSCKYGSAKAGRFPATVNRHPQVGLASMQETKNVHRSSWPSAEGVCDAQTGLQGVSCCHQFPVKREREKGREGKKSFVFG